MYPASFRFFQKTPLAASNHGQHAALRRMRADPAVFSWEKNRQGRCVHQGLPILAFVFLLPAVQVLLPRESRIIAGLLDELDREADGRRLYGPLDNRLEITVSDAKRHHRHRPNSEQTDKSFRQFLEHRMVLLSARYVLFLAGTFTRFQ